MERMIAHTRSSDGLHRALIRMALVVMGLAALSLMVLAQEPPTVAAITGKILINGQDAAAGIPLPENTILETSGNALASITLADGSQLEIGPQTRLMVVKTAATGATIRLMRLKVEYGWVRAKASSAGADTAGLIFDIETSNAIIGAKLAKLNMEVSYDEISQETVGIAHGVELHAENVRSGEKREIPQGSTVLIQAEKMQVVEGTARTKSSNNSLVSDVMDTFTNTKTVLVVGGLVGATALTAVLVDQEEEVEAADFVGNFVPPDTAAGGDVIHSRLSIQKRQESDLFGFYAETRSGPNCQYDYTRDFTGFADTAAAYLTLAPLTYTETCQTGTNSVTLPNKTWTCKLRNERKVLRCTTHTGEVEYQRQ